PTAAPIAAPTTGKRTAPRATSSPSSATRPPTGIRVRNATAAAAPRTASATGIGHPCGLEARHVAEERERASYDRDRHRRAGPLAEPEAEIEQRLEAERIEHERVPGLRRAVRGDHRVHGGGLQPRRDERGRAGDGAVEHDRHAPVRASEREAREKR